MAEFLNTIKDLASGLLPKFDKGSTAGKLQNRDAYLKYRTDMIEQGQEPMTYAEWSKAQGN